MVIKHQNNTGNDKKEIGEKSNATHSPCKSEFNGTFANLHRVKVKKDVAENSLCPVSDGIAVIPSEYGFPYQILFYLVSYLW
jgi:hypothetical protein